MWSDLVSQITDHENTRPTAFVGLVLTSRISLLAFGEVFSRNTLMATGIFTFSPSGAQTPWNKGTEEFFTDNAHLNTMVFC